jgi:uncharacterized protein YjiS (DUF1127 family)
MTIFPFELTRLPEVIAVNFLRWKRRNRGDELERLSDRTLEDIGLAERPRRSFDGVKPFWMP